MSQQEPAAMRIDPPKRAFWRNLSMVWLVPIVALAVSLGIAWQTYAARGVQIEITFQNASGVTPGETTIRYRDVVIGTVEDVHFTPDLAQVVVKASIDRAVAETLPEDAQFWVVQPEVSARGITGLSTVLSGVYIEASFPPGEASEVRRFTGADAPPLMRAGQEGTRITLRTRDANRISEGAPILFRGIEVGQIEAPRLILSGDSVVFDAFIEAPHDRRLTTATRFWDTSGFNVSLGATGLSLNVGNLAALVTGGIAFDTVFSNGEPLNPGYVFDLFPDEQTARQSLFRGVAANAVEIAVEFDGSVNGLTTGAAVRFRGLRVGEVRAIGAVLSDDSGARDVRLRTTLAIDPQALGLPDGAGAEETLAFLEEAVADGMRARLATSSLFTAALIVELAELPDAAPATLERPEDSLAIMPSVYSELPDFTATAEGVLERINALPVEDLLNQAITLMASVEAVVSSEGTRQAPDAALALIEDIRGLVGGEDTQALPGELREGLAELRAVVEELRLRGAIDRLASVLDSADTIAANTATASADFPALVQDMQTLVDRAQGVEIEELAAAATRLLDSTEELVGSDQMRELPPALAGALAEVQQVLAALREGEAVENVNRTLASTRSAADSVAQAMESLPALSARLDRLVTQADSLIASYGARSDFNAEALDVMREFRATARAVTQLARTIERNPNSLLIGR
ncbi:MAG: MlaD family protein [Paracoccaceae bacterium]|uniref:PqiB family protein n=1 Tax=unclassified Seohaeicola TaxID=2641111 RepID=UPI00237A6442|nr:MULTISPECIES: MlaD family protein [unclassified Seohaeicola]MDD9707694.1 MlaD family protein [Seohaeicola sp. 4SK31]MDD9735936.1 MlaD family protein [Seohaeicola sp. SP36]MDM7969011.1 MlaD family protein [Paracoccaceae bacterium]